MKVLVLAEQEKGKITASTHATLAAAKMLSPDPDITLAMVNETLAENVTTAVLSFHNSQQGYTHILAPATTFGKNVLPRLAAQLNVGMISDIVKILAPDTFVRPFYAGNAFMTLKSLDNIKILSIRPAAFPFSETSVLPKQMLTLPGISSFPAAQLIHLESTRLSRPSLSDARIIVAGGRGLQSAANFKLLEKLADCLNAAIGATRAAVDAGFAPNDFQIGQTGKIVAPDVYIAIGISGAIQHIAGIKDSKVIIAINKDAAAPIFQSADYGLVGDLFDIVPVLIQRLHQWKKN